MPVILENGSEDVRRWLDPNTFTWTKELQSLLKPSSAELEIYAVSKDVGKVGNNSPTFIIPVASSENKSNIANFFAKGAPTAQSKSAAGVKTEKKEDFEDEAKAAVTDEPGETRQTVDHDGTEDNAPLPVPKEEIKKGIKRELVDVPEEKLPKKFPKTNSSPSKASPSKPAKKGKSATTNNTASPSKSSDKAKGSKKITSFFGK